MDINAAIERMRSLASKSDALTGTLSDDLSENDIIELQNTLLNMAIVWDGIDGWLSKSGAWPDAWLG